MKHATLKDVADKSGCSIGAVSVVLNDRPSTIRVSQEMREKILRVAEEIGYVPNYHAQSLHLKNSRTVGLVLGAEAHRRLANGFWAKYVSGMDRACRENGYDVLFVGPSNGTNELDRAVLQARQSRIDALLVIGATYSPELRATLDSLRFPVVYLQEPQSPSHPTVLLDEEPATRQAIELLIENGHNRLAYVTAEQPNGEAAHNHRLRRLRRLCGEGGLELQEVIMDASLLHVHQDTLEMPVRGTYAFMQEWLAAHPTPTAVAFFNDLIALGGVAALQQAGKSVPEEVSVFAFDDIRSVLAVPPLSVVSLELERQGARAVELALRMIEDPSQMKALRRHREVIRARFIDRGTVAPASGPAQ